MRRLPARTRHLLALLAVLGVFACDRVTPVAPVGSTITISVNPSRIDATGEAAVVTIIVRREDGTPVNPGTQVNISTTLGTLDPEVAFTDETGVAKSELSGDGRIGMATVSATTGAAALVSVDVQIGSVAASITLTATPSNVPKDPQGAEGVIELLALIRDDTGAPLGGGIVNFFAETGTLESRGGPIPTNDLGEAKDTLTVSRNDISTLLEPFFLVSAETAIEGGSLILDEIEIDIRGVPATITLQATPSTVPEAGTGDSPIRLTALVRDSLGDPLEGVGVNFLTDAGNLASEGRLISTDAEGRATDTLAATKEQLEAVPATNFTVAAETAGLGGVLLEDTFIVRIESSDPVALFEYEVTNLAAREVTCTFTGKALSLCAPNSFKWTSTPVTTPPSSVEQTFTGGDLFTAVFTFATPGIPYRIRLELSDNCGTATPYEIQVDDFVP